MPYRAPLMLMSIVSSPSTRRSSIDANLISADGVAILGKASVSGGSLANGPAIGDGIVFWGSGCEHLNSPTVQQSVGNDRF
jgi:hypothetical protein